MRIALSSAFILLLLIGCAQNQSERASKTWSDFVVGRPIGSNPATSPSFIGTVKPAEPRPPSPKPIVTPSGSITGRIVRVSANGFVVLSFPIGGVPALGSVLNVYRQGQKVGNLGLRAAQPRDRLAIHSASLGIRRKRSCGCFRGSGCRLGGWSG